MNITLDQARALVAVLEQGSFSKAAKSLNKTHSALVYSIKTLEAQTGLKLFDRSQYRGTPSSAGKRILEQCRKLLLVERDLKDLCKSMGSGWEPYIRIVYEGIFPFAPIVDTVDRLARKKVPTKFQVYSAFHKGVEDTFHEQQAHMMISLLPPQKDSFESVKLTPLRSMLVASSDHPLVKKKQNRLEDLRAHCFLTVQGSDSRLNLSTGSLDKESVFELNDFHSKKIAIAKGSGFGWMPEYLIAKELESGKFQIVNWTKDSIHTFFPHLYYKSANHIGKSGGAFLDEFLSRQRVPDCSKCHDLMHCDLL